MTNYRCFLTALALIICLPIARAEHHEKEEEKTPLGEEMSAINKAWRQIKKQAEDVSQNEETLKLLDQVIENCKTAVDMVPILSEEVSEDKRPAFIEAYKKEMMKLDKQFESLRSALEAGENGKAQELIKKIDDFKKKGHKDYKPEDD